MLLRFRVKIKVLQESREKRVHLTTYAYGIVSREGKLHVVIDFHSLFGRTLSTEYTKRDGYNTCPVILSAHPA